MKRLWETDKQFEKCLTCDGTGHIISAVTGEIACCPKCKGNTVVKQDKNDD